MFYKVSDRIREAFLEAVEENSSPEVQSAVVEPVKKLVSKDKKHKFRVRSKKKPPRGGASFRNKTNDADYSAEYMRQYRGEQGKDYQKTPDAIKALKREQKKRIEEKYGKKA